MGNKGRNQVEQVFLSTKNVLPMIKKIKPYQSCAEIMYGGKFLWVHKLSLRHFLRGAGIIIFVKNFSLEGSNVSDVHTDRG